jgi:hypothetical protein
MKAWKIKRARKKLAKWNEYIVSETSDLFGGHYKNMCSRTFKADCAESAIRRSLKHWERKHHRFHDKGASDLCSLSPTTHQWGRFEAVNIQKNFAYYFR